MWYLFYFTKTNVNALIHSKDWSVKFPASCEVGFNFEFLVLFY